MGFKDDALKRELQAQDREDRRREVNQVLYAIENAGVASQLRESAVAEAATQESRLAEVIRANAQALVRVGIVSATTVEPRPPHGNEVRFGYKPWKPKVGSYLTFVVEGLVLGAKLDALEPHHLTRGQKEPKDVQAAFESSHRDQELDGFGVFGVKGLLIGDPFLRTFEYGGGFDHVVSQIEKSRRTSLNSKRVLRALRHSRSFAQGIVYGGERVSLEGLVTSEHSAGRGL